MANKKLLYQNRSFDINWLPALPFAVRQVMEQAQSQHPDIRKVGEILEKDQVLTAKVLKIVNSAAYGFNNRINTIQNAVVLLGMNLIYSTVISSVVSDFLNSNMRGLWQHSYACSQISSYIAKTLKRGDAAEYSLAGLLHDFGKVIFSVYFTQEMKELNELASNENLTLVQAEEAVFSFNHTDVNEWIAAQWNLPKSLTNAMTYHHNPLEATEYKDMACVIHLADFITNLFEIGNSGDDSVPTFDPTILEQLQIDRKMFVKLIESCGELLESDPAQSIFA